MTAKVKIVVWYSNSKTEARLCQTLAEGDPGTWSVTKGYPEAQGASVGDPEA